MAGYRERVLPYLTNYGTTLAEKRASREKLDTYFRATETLILGQIAYASRKYQNAATLMNEAVELNPIDETIRYNFGVVAGLNSRRRSGSTSGDGATGAADDGAKP